MYQDLLLILVVVVLVIYLSCRSDSVDQARICVKPLASIVASSGDAIVLQATKALNKEQHDAIRRYFESALASVGLKVVILPVELDLIGSVQLKENHENGKQNGDDIPPFLKQERNNLPS